MCGPCVSRACRERVVQKFAVNRIRGCCQVCTHTRQRRAALFPSIPSLQHVRPVSISVKLSKAFRSSVFACMHHAPAKTFFQCSCFHQLVFLIAGLFPGYIHPAVRIFSLSPASLSVCLSAFLCVGPSVYLSVCLFVCPSVRRPVDATPSPTCKASSESLRKSGYRVGI